MIGRLLTRAIERRSELAGLWWLLAAVPLAALPHAWEQPPWVLAALLAATLWRAAMHWFQTRLPAAWVLVLLVLLGGGATLAQFGRISGQEAGTALLLVMIALKLLEIRSQRDLVVTVFLAYFVVVTTYFFNQSFLIAAYSLGSVWAITAALVQIHAGRTLTPSRIGRTATAMVVHAFPIMVVLFVVFPRVPGPLWGGGAEDEDTVARTGLSERMRPGDVARLLENESTAMRVRFDGPPPPPSQQYWRALVLTDFDGRSWRVDWQRPEGSLSVPEANDLPYTVMLEPTGSRYLPVLDYPSSIPPQTRLLDNLQVVASEPVHNRIQYRAAAYAAPRTDIALAPAVHARYLSLPERSAPRARVLAEQWRLDHGADDLAIVSEALALFAADPYRYTLRPPPLAGDATDAFLFSVQAGYCEHYASSFAVLMRAAGIPTRVVTGYQGGQWMSRGDYLHLRHADAHAWNEVWLDGQGWVRIDPTAAIAPERIETGLAGLFSVSDAAPSFLRRSGLSWGARWRLQIADWHDLLTFRWEHMVLAFDPERQRELFARFGLDATDWRSILVVTFAAFSAIGVSALAFAWWQRPRVPADPDRRLLDRLSRRLARVGLGRSPHESALRYATRVGRQRPEWAAELAAFADAYTQLRYAHPDPDEQTRQRARMRRALRLIDP